MRHSQDITTKILNTALSLYSKFGIKSITMDDLSRELGISKKTIYEHVSDKNDLISKAIRHEHEFIKKQIAELREQSMNAIDELIELNRMIHKNHAIHNPTFYFDLKKYYKRIYIDWMHAKQQDMLSMLRNNMEKGIKEGIYRQDLNVEIISKVHMSRVESFSASEIIDDEELSDPRFLDEVFKYHIHGICNSRGLAYYSDRMAENG